MIPKFPSGRESITFHELRMISKSQQSCGICKKPWIIGSDGCIRHNIHVFHPCQHFVGSGCWSDVPDEMKDRCPVCKVEVQSNEDVRVTSSIGASDPLNRDLVVDTSMDIEAQLSAVVNTLKMEVEANWNHTIAVKKKMEEGLNLVDIRAIMYYMNLRARLHAVEDNLENFLASTTAITPRHRQGLVFFLKTTPQTAHDSDLRKIQVALSAFNIAAGTSFTINDLRKTLPSAEDWVKSHFDAILSDPEKAATDTLTKQDWEDKLAYAKAEIEELKNRQRREGAVKKAIEEIESKAELDILKIRVAAEEIVANIYANLEAQTFKIGAKAKEDAAKIESQG